LFEFDSYELRAEATGFDLIADILMQYRTPILLSGLLTVSARQNTINGFPNIAPSGGDYLARRGVQSSRQLLSDMAITTDASNATDQGRRLNRGLTLKSGQTRQY
jgi:hypothetical protein